MYCSPETAVNVPAATKSASRTPGGIASGHDTLTSTIVTDASWKKVVDLADHARPHLDPLAGEDEEEEVADQQDDVAEQHQHRQPVRHELHEGEHAERAQQEELVGERVEDGAELGLGVGEPGDRAVERVGDAAGDEDARAPSRDGRS